MLRRIAIWASILTCGLVAAGPVRAADGLVQARNFQADARVAAGRGVPLLVFFTSPGCHFCERVRRVYLIPMSRDRTYRNQVLIREVTVGAHTPLTDFDGSRTTSSAFAAAHRVFMVPTVKMLDHKGNEVAEPIVGLLTEDYYYGHLQAAIENGIKKIRAP